MIAGSSSICLTVCVVMAAGSAAAGAGRHPRKLGFFIAPRWTTLRLVPTERVRNRTRERLRTLGDAGLDAEQVRFAAIAELRRAVAFGRWCWPLTDPDSVLSTNGIGELDFWPSLPRLIELEEHGDVTRKPQLALSARASVALSAATGGDLARSPRWRECLSPYGIGDELMTVCRDRHGCWGSVELMRDSDDRPFEEVDVRFLHELAPTLGMLVRRSLRRSWHANPAHGPALPPATVILDEELRPASWTHALPEWLVELGGDTGGMLPPALYEIGTRARTPAEAATGLPSSVRIRTSSGRWVTVEGAALEGSAAGHVAVTIRTASSGEVFDLLCKVHELTRRERQVAALMLEGLATKQLAQACCISPHTVQDHLKSIFAKTELNSRRARVSYLAGRAR
jgi:DNA-binding CsgD family transcriptional regulator